MKINTLFVLCAVIIFTLFASMGHSAEPLINYKKAVNIARNPSCTGYPSVAESSNGWGSGLNKCSIIDGKREYDSWANGLAFTGGHSSAAGGAPYVEPAGPRYVVVNFGTAKTFNSLVVWHHGVEHTPQYAVIKYWNGTTWVDVPFIRTYSDDMRYQGTESGNSCADVYTIGAPVTASKVLYGFDNRNRNILGTYNIHGWIYEIEVYSPSK